MTLLDEGKVSAKDDFLRELEAFGAATPATQQRLADELGEQKKAKNSPGRKPKVIRDMSAYAWFRIAEEFENWTRADAYDQLANRRLFKDVRNVKRILAKMWQAIPEAPIIPTTEGYLCIVFVGEPCFTNLRTYRPPGSTKRYIQATKKYSGKNSHLFYFAKSEFYRWQK